MYTTCIHCNARLGANEVIEPFPVGRRLAFDAARGRLWVVCPRCHRWNLTPLEERWEAIEECERQYHTTKLHASTDNIGLAKTREGLELVRIGKPLRPEMAAWRYAREFRRRWRTYALPLSGTTVVFTAAQTANVAELFNPLLRWSAVGVTALALVLLQKRGRHTRIVGPDGTATTLSARDLAEAALVPTGREGWSLRISNRVESSVVEGAPAHHRLRAILTAQNFTGGLRSKVDLAVGYLTTVGSAEEYIARLARVAHQAGDARVASLEPAVRLALEMAFHEETERRAMEGEMQDLVEEWRVAEEIAAIADDMMLPAAVVSRFRQLVGESNR